MKKISRAMEIRAFFHCNKCLKEFIEGALLGGSARDYQSIETGYTDVGLQVWCKRHRCNIIHIDFEGERHPASEGAIR